LPVTVEDGEVHVPSFELPSTEVALPPIATGQTHWLIASDPARRCTCNRVFPAYQRCVVCGGLPERRQGYRDRRGGLRGLTERPAHYRVAVFHCSCGFDARRISTVPELQREVIQSHLRDDLFTPIDGTPRRYRRCERCGISAACREVRAPSQIGRRYTYYEASTGQFDPPLWQAAWHCDDCSRGYAPQHTEGPTHDDIEPTSWCGVRDCPFCGALGLTSPSPPPAP
jgi:hypothetical protein